MNTASSDSDSQGVVPADTEADPVVEPINLPSPDPANGNAVANLEHGDVALPPDSQGRSVFSV